MSDETITAATPPDQPDDMVGFSFGPYRILSGLGEGGFGVVYLAEQTEPVRRRVALKIIKPGMDSRAVLARFAAERHALALMDHNAVAKVLDAGTTDRGLPYFVMELVEGDPITDFCDKHRKSIDERIGLMISVCNAVQHAHTKGVIHRDLKPSNILVAYDPDGHAQPKIIDFGVAKALNQRLTEATIFTHHGNLVGTPEYMSPEQAEMSATGIDTRSDIYSLGVLLYELLTGSRPFELRDAALSEIQRIIRETDPPKPSTRLSTVATSDTDTASRIALTRKTELAAIRGAMRRDLDWVVMKCLEKDRERRYDTANAVALDLRRYLDNQPILAGPPSATYRISKFIKRNRAGVIAASLILCALLVGLVGTTWGLIQTNAQRKIAVEARLEAEYARAQEQQRADELQQVGRFQARQINEINPALMGSQIRRSIIQTAPTQRRDALEEEFRAINFTDVALDTLRVNLLERSITVIDEQFSNQPIMRAQLLHAVASTANDLGLLQLTIEPLQRAMRIYRRELGDEHRNTLSVISDMGVFLVAQGRNDEAEKYYEESLDSRRRTLGVDHPDTLASLNNMGYFQQVQGNTDQAEEYYREALERRRRVLGDEHPDTLASLNNLGFILEAQGIYDEAYPYYREALDSRRRILGNDHRDTLTSINNMAYLLESMGEQEMSEKYYREALEGSRRILGNEHPDTLGSVNNLAAMLGAQGRLEEAEPLYREALDGRRRILGDEHPHTLNSINNMGFLLASKEEYEEAEPYYRESLNTRRRVQGDLHVATLQSLLSLGRLNHKQNDLEDAAQLLSEALEGARQVRGDDHPFTLRSMSELAIVLAEQGRAAQAFVFADEVVNRARTVFGDQDERLGIYLVRRGRVLELQGEYTAAAQSMEEGYAIIAAALGEHDPQSLESLSFLVRLHTAWHESEPNAGHNQSADVWRAKLEAAQAESDIEDNAEGQ